MWTVIFCAAIKAPSSTDVSFYVSVVPGMNAGTTATVALLRDSIELVVGSVGDSRAMLCRKGKAVKLTVDHTPERKDEKERCVDIVIENEVYSVCGSETYLKAVLKSWHRFIKSENVLLLFLTLLLIS